MPKKVFFIRHAKSDWESGFIHDIERPLNERGTRDAPIMANRLKQKINSDILLISSPAKRALTTAYYFAETLGILKEKVLVKDTLYNTSLVDILECIRSTPEASTIALFGHNPELTILVNLSKTMEPISNIPTCGIVEISYNVASWKEVGLNNGEVLSFDYPKKI